MKQILFLFFLIFNLNANSNYIEYFRGLKIGIIPIAADKNLLDKSSVPQFFAQTLEGQRVENKDIHGPAIIIFWNASCSMCKEPLMSLSNLMEKINKEKLKVNILTVSTDSPQVVMEYLAKHKISLKTIIDSEARVFRAFGARATPLFYIVDKKQYVRGIIPGVTDVKSGSFWKLLEYLSKR